MENIIIKMANFHSQLEIAGHNKEIVSKELIKQHWDMLQELDSVIIKYNKIIEKITNK